MSALIRLLTTRKLPPRNKYRFRAQPRLEVLEERSTPAVFVVSDLSDSPGDMGSIRYALNQINADGSSDADAVQFAAGLSGVIAMSNGEFALTRTAGTISIQGPGPNILSIDGGQMSSVFSLTRGVTASIAGITITDGAGTSDGGAIYNYGSLTILNCVFSGNTASNGGAIYNEGSIAVSNSTFSGNSAEQLFGGAIVNYRSLTATQCTFINNTVAVAGGGISNGGTATLTACTFTGNSAFNGGGLENDGTATVANCTFVNNLATNAGGAVRAGNGVTKISNSTIGNNSSPSGAGLAAANGSTSLLSTIVTGSATSNISGNVNVPESTFNLIGPGGSGGLTDGVSNNQVGVPLASTGLDPLNNYGGPTTTMALASGSLALQRGSAELTTLVGDIDTASSVINVSDPTYLGIGEVFAVDGEQMQITALNGAAVTVTRAVDGTIASAHASGASVVLPADERGSARSIGGSTDVGAVESQTTTVQISRIAINAGTAPILGASESASTVTITTDGPHGFRVGDPVVIAGVGGGYDGGFTVATVSTFGFTINFGSIMGLPSLTDRGTATDTALNGGLLLNGPTAATSQRSMVDSIVYQFNQAVSLGAGAFSIFVVGNAVGTAPALTYSSPDGGVTWVVTFGGAGVIGNSIANGEYQIVLNSSAVAAIAGGGSLAANDSETFYRLYGDTRGNGHQRVSAVDRNTFNGSFGVTSSMSNFLAYLDADGNGRVAAPDRNSFNGDFGLVYSGFSALI